jgi:hypothetical protein
MSKFKTFLTLLPKINYPSNEIFNLMGLMGYTSEDILPELVKEVGKDMAIEFIQKTLSAISTPNKGIKIPLDEYFDSKLKPYFYLEIKSIDIDFSESETDILVLFSFGDDSRIVSHDDKEITTIDELWSETDMGDLGEFSDFLNDLKYEAIKYIHSRTGLTLDLSEVT